MSRGMPILATCSSTRSHHSTEKRCFHDGRGRQTHRHTTHRHHDLQTELAQWANSVKICEWNKNKITFIMFLVHCTFKHGKHEKTKILVSSIGL